MKTPESLDYYVRFQNVDKRNDCWLSFSEIKQTDQEIVQIDYKEKLQDLSNLHPYDNSYYGLSAADFYHHEQITKVKRIEHIQIGKYKVATWYASLYPPQYHNLNTLYICEFCLSFFAYRTQLERHDEECILFHPPGDQIYRDETKKISVFEVDGFKQEKYCQNLGLLAKMFLDHKSLRVSTSSFLFYILCDYSEGQFHFVGYFSKCKDSVFNLSCILVLPFYMKKGWGKFLINFSYELSLIDEKEGSPEKPLSNMGRKAYLSYWTQKITECLNEIAPKKLTIKQISKKTAITSGDIEWTLEKCQIIKNAYGRLSVCSDEKTKKELAQIIKRPCDKLDHEKIHYIPHIKINSESAQENQGQK